MPQTHAAPFALLPQPAASTLAHPQPRRSSLLTDVTLRLDTQNALSYSHKARGSDSEYHAPPPPPPSPISW